MDSAQLKQQVTMAASSLARRIGESFDVAVVLGSGLSSFVAQLHDTVIVPYNEIPGFPVSPP